ncbi:SDR family NAD(P)-dependent oxidoreductase [Aestuariispira ectoiniformans]|uniref:SDR family NAD(P)-dependent oxidoreductase n=1 Tax=Aestuariispira ectoiniformans TaxID=2775080 RepID=UPI00223ACDDB|nr:SDR family oxidoreductase [Aestuariispira ectoiniformans]
MTNCAVVTGGVRGIGRQIALKLADAGFQVFATYRSNREAAENVERDSGGRIKAIPVDGGDIRAVEEFRAVVLQTGTPTVLVNNAGVTGDGLLMENGIQRIAESMNNNFMGTVNFTLTFLDDMMKKREGNIINLSSSAAHKIKPGNAAYGCSKIAIERFSKGLAKEVGRFNIFVNCVAPGWVETEMFKTFAGPQRKEILKDIPTRKILQPEEVAQVVTDLAMRRTNTTGSVLTLGNGEQII